MTNPQLTQTLWRSIEPTYRAILAHPFLTGLTDATLPIDSFVFYVTQDRLYLRAFARVLSVLAGRGQEPDETAMFARHAANAITVEHSLHSQFLAELGITEEEANATPMAPTCQAYASYLEARAYGSSFAEGVAAVLPCYWIYREVGNELLKHGSRNEQYDRWIQTYGSEEFDEVVREALALTDRLGEEMDEAERQRVSTCFVTAASYEWMFWDMAYRREKWPPFQRLTAIAFDTDE
jgi:thiaminase/transcriptional activator TenA